jgi:HK97 family phage portal protein
MVLDPDRVTVRGSPPRYTVAGETYDRRTVCHIRHLSWPREPYGFSPLGALARTMGVAEWLERYAQDLLRNGGIATTLLRHPGKLNKQQARDLQQAWVDAQSIPGAPKVLSSQIEFEVLGLAPADLAMLDLRTMSEQRCASVFGVPPPLLGLPGADSLTYSTTQHLLDLYWRATLRARAQNVMRAISGWALPRGHTVGLNEDRFVEPQLPERAVAYKTLIEAGVIDADEAREMEGLPSRGSMPTVEGSEEVAL